MNARSIPVAASILGMITVNGLANALPINGQQTGEISDRFDVLFVPAGYVFSIWGLIYLGLLAYGVFQALPRNRDNARVRGIDAPVILNCTANGAWIFAWHYEQFALSLALMLVLLGSLIWTYVRLDIGRAEVPAGERWFVHLPFSIYLGWITVATIANTSTVLVHFGWSGWGVSALAWLSVMLAAALAVAAVMTWMRRDVAFLAVLTWAFVGIAVKHADARSIALVAGASAALAASFALFAAVRRRAPPRELATR